MPKALVIKGADFGANAVTTITFASIPCTGIEFETDTISLTSMESVEVEYTLTPSDTTDTVAWSSSDSSVVSVSGGVLTVNGIGTATITATCGSYSDTATVTVSVAYIPNWAWGYPSHAEGKSFLTFVAGGYIRLSALGTGSQAATYNMPIGGENSVLPIKIPANTKRIRCSRGENAGSYIYNADIYFGWMKDEASGDTNFPSSALFVSSNTGGNLRTSQSTTVDVPDGADCVCPMVRANTTYTEQDDPGTIANTLGLTIEFLATETD